MTKPTISLIAAMAKHRVIGLNNALPWDLPEDMAHFKRMTLGKPIVMGRKTYESMGKPLPGRHNVIITRNKAYQVTACSVVHSLQQAIEQLSDVEEIMIIGGTEIYTQALPIADKMYLTFIDLDVAGDAWFPVWDESQWQQLSYQQHDASADNKPSYAFVEYKRIDA